MSKRVEIDGEVIKDLRTSGFRPMSRRELADRVGIEEHSIGQYERGEVTSVLPVIIEALARVLMVGPNDIAPNYQPPMPLQLGRVGYDKAELSKLFYRSGMTKVEWAKESGFSVSTAHRLLDGDKMSADVEILYKAAHGLSVPVGRISQPLSNPPGYGEREMMAGMGSPLEDFPIAAHHEPAITDTPPPESH